jgi:DNA-binding GntR family transcriptional regulator
MTQSELNLMIDRPEETVPAQVVRVVRQAILDGELPPGYRLTERELVERTGVSRTSIRQAVQHLRNLGLIESISGRDIRVVVLDSDDVRNIYEVRDALEPAATESFVRHASAEQVAELLACVPNGDMDPEQRLRAVYRFDDLLIDGSHNPLMKEILGPLHTRIHSLRRLSTSTEGRLAASDREFRELADAIRDRDPDRAAAASHRHVRAARDAALVAVERLENQKEDASL